MKLPDYCFKTFKGYRLNKILFQLFFIASLYVIYQAGASNNWELNYFECNGLENCKNPFYKPSSWYQEEYVKPGHYGNDKAGELINSLQIKAIIGIVLIFGLNHILHNRDFKGLEGVESETQDTSEND